MNLEIGTLRKIAGVIKVLGAVVSLGIIMKYDKIKTDGYIDFSKSNSWEK